MSTELENLLDVMVATDSQDSIGMFTSTVNETSGPGVAIGTKRAN